MPGMMPQRPEGRNYFEYEEQREDALRLSVIRKSVPYIIRFRAPEPTTELFAYDMVSLVTTLKSLGKYSLMEARITAFEGVGQANFGVNQNGIVFNHAQLPFNLEEVPYKAELGYFIGDVDSYDGGERSMNEELEENDVVDLRRHLTMTGQ